MNSFSNLATPTTPASSADQAAALYAEQYQQYAQQYQAWAAANPGYQHPQAPPGVAPGAPTATNTLDYSAYYQQYQQPPPPATQQPGQPPQQQQQQQLQQQQQQQLQQQQQQELTPEQYAQQYAAYYAQYYQTQAAPGSVPSSTGATAPATAQAGAAPYSQAQYQDYYAQQAQASQPYSYPSSAPGTQAPAYNYAAYQTPGQPAQPAPLTPYPYSYQQPPQSQQQQQSYSSSSYSSNPPNSSYHQSYPAQSGPSHSSYPSGQYGKFTPRPHSQQGQSKTPFDYQAFQKQKHLEAKQRYQESELKISGESDKNHAQLQKRLSEATLGDDGYSTSDANMAKTKLEKPAYLSVKSKKVKPLTTNVLESKDPEPSPSSSAPPPSRDAWPESLKEYVVRYFNTVAEEDQEAAQEDLKSMVARYHGQGKLWEIDWDNMQIPSRKLSDSPEPETLGSEERAKREKRMRRFEEDAMANKPPSRKAARVVYAQPVNNGDVIDWDRHTIVGTNTNLEKHYLRLTSAPDPSTVRPLHVLRETLDLLKRKWSNHENYAYICDQLKSVRQDLTVQRIKNDFTVAVYEIHARIALEKGDLGEYNQCQTQLKALYELKLPGSVMEFTAYRILYLLHTRNPSDIIAMLRSLTPAQKEDSSVRHALKVRTALASSNYQALFRLYLDAPNMGPFLMDQFVDRERVQAMARICASYKPGVTLESLVETLGYKTTGECLSFLKSINVSSFLTTREKETENGKEVYQYLDTKNALPYVNEAGKKYQKVDIKGQI
ncbi:hypothetical protein BGX26_006248 [Mortierella sp. AD094]|nr:hypothetical protein BGX26_006248 [Mortierella sp. AD094]